MFSLCVIAGVRFELTISWVWARSLRPLGDPAVGEEGVEPSMLVVRRQIYSLLHSPLCYPPKTAEDVGFEPTRPFSPPHFKCGTIDHSDNLPVNAALMHIGLQT